MSYTNILLVAAVVPGFFLMMKIYELDKIEKEPTKLLAALAGLGALSTVSALILEMLGMFILDVAVPYGTLYMFLENFIVVACVEEAGKYFVLKKVTWKHPAFDYRFDAVVYAVATGLGFAILENIEYAFSYGIMTTLLRAITAIPGHTIFAIFMGHYYGIAKQESNKGNEEAMKKNLILAFVVPVILHGVYDFTASGMDVLSTLIFFAFVIVVDIIAYRNVKKYAAEDATIIVNEIDPENAEVEVKSEAEELAENYNVQ